jgi:hypothetical protein
MINWQKWERLKASWSAVERTKDGLFYMGPGGNGDLLYNTARKIIETDDKSEWAYSSLEAVFSSLNEGKRWPDSMSDKITTTNHKQTDMTQDPWILAYCCAIHLERTDLIEKYKPGIRIFNLPDKWAWRRALLGKPNLWGLYRRITPHNLMQDFVYVFYGFMERSLVIVQNTG